MPLVASTETTLQRCLRASILLSWIAFEEVVKSCLRDRWSSENPSGPMPTHLYEQVAYQLSSLGKSSLDRAEYTRFRRLRNDIAHANDSHEPLTLSLEEGLGTFNFCFRVASDLLPYPLRNPNYIHSYNASLR
jgi:hypothetical protein